MYFCLYQKKQPFMFKSGLELIRNDEPGFIIVFVLCLLEYLATVTSVLVKTHRKVCRALTLLIKPQRYTIVHSLLP
jgi:hypothetical protein